VAKIKFSNLREIGDYQEPYFIAEVNSSHNGSVETAKLMVDAALAAGCSCVKFQSWSPESLYSKSYYDANPIAKRIVKKFSFSEESLLEMAQYCHDKGIDFASTPYSEKEADFLVEECGVPFIKIASMEINNYSFIRYIARKGIPIILSTGMADLNEIRKAVSCIEDEGNPNLCLLHCISIYPCDAKSIRLHNILGLRDTFPEYPIGFSDHSLGMEMACAATTIGAAVIEKHLTLDAKKMGMDNNMAMEPENMSLMIQMCNNIHSALGGKERIVPEEELKQRLNMRRSVVTARKLLAGSIITKEDLTCKRPGTGISPERLETLIGKKIVRDLDEDVLLNEEDYM